MHRAEVLRDQRTKRKANQIDLREVEVGEQLL